MKTRLITACLSLSLVLGACASATPTSPHQQSGEAQATPPLRQRLSQTSDKERLAVQIWLHTNNKSSTPLQPASGQDRAAWMAQVEQQRAAARLAYRKQNSAFQATLPKDSNVLFVSEFSPLLLAELTKPQVERLLRDPAVAEVDVLATVAPTPVAVKPSRAAKPSPQPPKVDPQASLKNIRAHITRDQGLVGKGIKVGIVEPGHPDTAAVELAHLDIINREKQIASHTTDVATVIAGKTLGIAPGVTIYSATSLGSERDYRAAVEWLLSQGCVVINMSAHVPREENLTYTVGNYTSLAKWLDHLAAEHQAHFVISAGNNNYPANEEKTEFWITSPQMAYNVHTVGSIYDRGTAQWEDDVWGVDSDGEIYSAHVEREGTAYKPDLTAPGSSVFGRKEVVGTSFAAPHVTGVIAQLLQAKPELVSAPAAMKAILAAGTTHRTARDYGFDPAMPFYSDREGAGVVDALGAYETVKSGSYRELKLTPKQFPHSLTFTVAPGETQKRVSLAWVKQNRMGPALVPVVPKLANLDLHVIGPDGTVVGRSESTRSNVEVVEFKPARPGTYTIRVVARDLSPENPFERVGIAWR